MTELARALKGGSTVPMRFTFDNGAVIETAVPMGLPLSDLPRSPMELHEEEGEGSGH